MVYDVKRASFIDGIIEFLVDMEWIKYNHTRGLYQMTKIGEMEVRMSASKVFLWIWIALDLIIQSKFSHIEHKLVLL